MTDTLLPETPSTELKFSDMALSAELLQAVTEMGFQTPSPIQAQALPILLGERTDFLGLAATGTGKTAAFAIPLLEKIDPTLRQVQALVLCPTRELAIQVSEQINLLGRYLGVKSVPVYGGAGYRDQIRGIERGAPIVVGTPGRVQDHINQGTLSLETVNLVVLDEADEMISMGFREAIENILNGVDEETRNIWLFSATMERDVRRVADEFLKDPEQVEVNRKEKLPENIEQFYYVTQESNKPEVLCKLIDAADDFYGLIFCQTKVLVNDLTHFLQSKGYHVDCLHGDKDQSERERTLKSFRERLVTVLVCTDVAARGIDVKDVTHVINYSIPRELDSYVHRIGRTARSGKKGFAFSLITPNGRGLVFRLERVVKRKLVEGKIPTRKEICAKKLRALLTRFQNETGAARATQLMGDEWKQAIASLSGEEVAARLIAMSFPDIFKDFEKAKAEQAKPEQERKARAPAQPAAFDANEKLVIGEPPARARRNRDEDMDEGDSDERYQNQIKRPNPWDRSRSERRSFSKPEFLKRDFEGRGFEDGSDRREAGERESRGGFGEKRGGFGKPREFNRESRGGFKGDFNRESRGGFKGGFNRESRGGFKGGFKADFKREKGAVRKDPSRPVAKAVGGERALRKSDF